MDLSKIPNSLVLALAAAFFVHALATGWSIGDIAQRAGLGLAVLLVMMVASLKLDVGAGVLKLIIVAFLWYGVEGGFTFVGLSMGLCWLAITIRKAAAKTSAPMPYLPFAAIAAFLMSGVPLLA